jgi:peroxiredoxin Q/BCP
MLTTLLTAILLGATPKVGDVAPDFTVKDTEGTTYTLSKMLEKGPVILAFFPKAFTSGCTKELTAYSAGFPELGRKGVQLIAVSVDDVETQKKFKASLGATFALVADPDRKLVELYDVKMPVVGVASRVTFVIGKDRKITSITTGGDAVDISGASSAAALACGG